MGAKQSTLDEGRPTPKQPTSAPPVQAWKKPTSAPPTILPFTSECEIVPENESNRANYDKCNKNPGHPKFYSASEWKDNLPSILGDPKYTEYIQCFWDRTVRVVAWYTSKDRPDKYPNSTFQYPCSSFKGMFGFRRNGTGCISVKDSHPIQKEKKECPCPICKESEEPKTVYWKVFVITATHVVYDDSEAEEAEFACFYDSGDALDPDKEFTLFGLRVQNKDFDQCTVECITHNGQMVQKIGSILENFKSLYENIKEDPFGYSAPIFIVSHPHGCSKRISFGDISQYFMDETPSIQPGNPSLFDDETYFIVPVQAKPQTPDESQASKLQEGENITVTSQENVISTDAIEAEQSGCREDTIVSPGSSGSVARMPGRRRNFLFEKLHQIDRLSSKHVIRNRNRRNKASNSNSKAFDLLSPYAANPPQTSRPRWVNNKCFPYYTSVTDQIIAGQRYRFPPGTTFTIPTGEGYLSRNIFSCDFFQDEGTRGSHDCRFGLIFPPRTKITFPSGEEVRLPEETEFYTRLESTFPSDSPAEYWTKTGYLAYDVCTCPGSSGAAVNFDPDSVFLKQRLKTHEGAMLEGNINRSQRHYWNTVVVEFLLSQRHLQRQRLFTELRRSNKEKK